MHMPYIAVCRARDAPQHGPGKGQSASDGAPVLLRPPGGAPGEAARRPMVRPGPGERPPAADRRRTRATARRFHTATLAHPCRARGPRTRTRRTRSTTRRFHAAHRARARPARHGLPAPAPITAPAHAPRAPRPAHGST
ncbi:hypothetical protein SSP531S_04620 [Streptomyces spongiicola]|uniref:Uncharacterized protein n=1 Tax=Streptomyces spongiicola TaxID=1690221 RepID=A0A388SR10_9ACTN|nr:hypothetical protein SSP531S_04620 [Streptomyces spongiicola]